MVVRGLGGTRDERKVHVDDSCLPFIREVGPRRKRVARLRRSRGRSPPLILDCGDRGSGYGTMDDTRGPGLVYARADRIERHRQEGGKPVRGINLREVP